MSWKQPPNDEAARKKAIDDWVPIDSSRKGKLWYSSFHNITAMVGTSVLSLPYCMAELGWYGSLIPMTSKENFHFLYYEHDFF